MDDELGTKHGDLALTNGIGLVFILVILGMSLLIRDWCCLIPIVLCLPVALVSLRHIYVAVYEKGLVIRSLFGKCTILWADIAEIQVDVRVLPQYVIAPGHVMTLGEHLVSMIVAIARLMWIYLEVFVPLPTSKYTFTLRDGQIVKLHGNRFLVDLEPMMMQHIAPFIADDTIYTTVQFPRAKRLYHLSDKARKLT